MKMKTATATESSQPLTRKWHLWENAKNVFRFPKTENPDQQSLEPATNKVAPPFKPDRRPSKVQIYPGVLFVQQGPL